MSFSEWDQRCMTLALEEARRAADRGEVPVGAVLTRGEVVLAHGGNAQIELHDVTAHAEIRVLREAGVRDSNYRLPGTTLYVTLEPCTMCCGALVHARVERLVFATREPTACFSCSVNGSNNMSHIIVPKSGSLNFSPFRI